MSNNNMNPIKLIYDRYENDLGIYYEEIPDTIKDNETLKNEILKLLPNKVNDLDINRNRVFQIYSWGIKKSSGIDCDIVFDLTTFQTKLDPSLDVHSLNGFSNEIQDSIILHPKFIEIIEKIVTMIEINNPKKVGFFCNHGKHRSVGWAEIIKKYYYEKAKVKHLCNPRKNILV